MEENARLATFDLTGAFGGFVFTTNGKRRLMLRIGGTECLFKVPRFLRRRVIGNFRAGQVLRVLGVEEQSGNGIASKRTVERIVPADGVAVTGVAEPVRAEHTIKVCAKKNCWRSGGRELLTAFRDEAAACGMADRVEFKAVDCLDRCKQAPNADSPWREYRWCTPPDARAILAEVAHRLGQATPRVARTEDDFRVRPSNGSTVQTNIV